MSCKVDFTVVKNKTTCSI